MVGYYAAANCTYIGYFGLLNQESYTTVWQRGLAVQREIITAKVQCKSSVLTVDMMPFLCVMHIGPRRAVARCTKKIWDFYVVIFFMPR